jgi:dihydrofolate reductase
MDLWLCGGGRPAAALLPEIDELIIKSYPVVAGGGVPAFSGAFRPTSFTPTDRRSFSNGAQVTWFTRTA